MTFVDSRPRCLEHVSFESNNVLGRKEMDSWLRSEGNNQSLRECDVKPSMVSPRSPKSHKLLSLNHLFWRDLENFGDTLFKKKTHFLRQRHMMVFTHKGGFIKSINKHIEE